MPQFYTKKTLSTNLDKKRKRKNVIKTQLLLFILKSKQQNSSTVSLRVQRRPLCQ